MSKLDKDFKKETDKGFRESDYITRKLLTRTVAVTAALVVIAGIFYVGYTLTVGKWQTNAEREIFKKTTAYSEAAAQFLADSYADYDDAETDKDRDTICQYVIMRYPNLDLDTIDNLTLRQFYNMCLNN